jgi:hypothetical protein
MARFRGRDDVQIEIEAVRNDGQWPEILRFLDDTGLSRLPLFGNPPVTREEDGSLIIRGNPKPVPVGGWLGLAAGQRLAGFTADEFLYLFEPIEDGK